MSDSVTRKTTTQDVAMTWYDQIEQKRTLLVTGIFAICVTALAVTARRNPVAFDSYWHLQTGLDWLNNGLSPWIDHYSFTYAGEAIRSQPFTFQVLLAWLVNNFGLEPGFQLYKLAGFLSAFGLFALFLKKLRSPVIVYCMLLPLFVLLVELRSTVRPELLGYSFSIVGVMLYHRAQGQITLRNLLPIALLLFVWTNYHVSILGFILFFGFFIDAAVLQLKRKSGPDAWMKWLLSGLIILGIGFLNKSLSHPIINAFLFAPEWKEFIQEFQPATMYHGVKGIYVLVVLVITTLILTAWRQRFGYLIVTVILTYFAVQMARMVTPCGIIILCIFVSTVSELDLQKAIAESGKLARSITGTVVLLMALTALYSSVISARYFMEENKTSALIRPEAIVEYMKDNQKFGHIFNEYGIGGYLIYSLSPDSKVYIDGRTNILYPLSHHKRFLNARNSPEVLRQEIEKHNINLAILESDQRAYSVMRDTGLLGLDFVDHRYALFVRDQPNFPTTGKLLGNPACWDDNDALSLENEHNRAIWILPAYSSLLPTLGMMFNFSKESDKEKFLREFAESPAVNVHQLRFAAYQALSLGLNRPAVNLLQKISSWGYREFLSAAMAHVGMEEWRKAEEIVDQMTMIHWPYVTGNDVIMQYRILETIKQRDSLRRIPLSYLENLREQVINLGHSPDVLELDLGLLCAH